MYILQDACPANELMVYMVFAVNFAHKASAAFLLGYFTHAYKSVTQVWFVLCSLVWATTSTLSQYMQTLLLLILQLMMLTYLVSCKPYINRSLQFVEIVCHAVELGLLCAACCLLYAESLLSDVVNGLQWSLIGKVISRRRNAMLRSGAEALLTSRLTGAFVTTALLLILFECWRLIQCIKHMLEGLKEYLKRRAMMGGQ